jgi:hypothetical protein
MNSIKIGDKEITQRAFRCVYNRVFGDQVVVDRDLKQTGDSDAIATRHPGSLSVAAP